MKKFNFSKKFERLTSFVLALMLVLSVFTASNVAVFADTEDKNVKTKETQDQVDLYVKSSTVPCIKSSTEKNYQVMSAYANGYYSAKVNKAGTAVSSPDSADKAKYQLADFTMDDSKVYFVKPADWNSSDIKAHFGYSNDEANDIPMDSVSNSVFLKDSKSNTVSNLTLGNNEKLYSVTIPAGMTNVIFYYNNYEKQTNDIINISVGNCYKLTEGTTENGTIFNAESIGSVGSLNKLNKSYSFTESTVIDFTDFSAVKTLKMSDLNLKAGDTELSENSETVLEKSNDKFSVENANGFDVKVYYNNTEITSVSDIKEYDKKVSLTVKLSDIPDMTREYEVKVNSGLVIDGGKWQFNKTDVTSIENNINVYAPSSGKEFEVTPKFEPKLKCNGETVESGAKITYYNSHDKEIQKLEFTNSDSQTLKYKVSYNNYTVTGEITVNCYFVSVALTSLKSDTNSFVDESKETIYQKGESCSYDVKLDSNLTAKDINFSIDNGAKVDYSSSSNSNKLTISNLTKESNLTIKYPTEEGFEVKKYKVVPDNKAPEIEEIKFDSENAKFDVDNGLYKNGDITFTIKLKNEDSGSGIFDGSLTGNDVFSCNFDQSKNVFNCTLRDKTINGDTVFTITDRVGNKESFSFNKLIDSGKVYVYNTPITNNNFEVVSSTEKPTANISSYNATGTNAFNDNNIYHGDQLTVTLDLNNVISGLQSISGLSVSGFESYNFSNFKLTKINEKEQSVTANSFDELATEFENQATNEKVKSATVTFDIDIKDNPNYSGSHKLSLTVTDNSGNVNSGVDNSTFYVDNTAPEITNVEFVKTTNPTVTDQILNFLTFGIYSNDTIVMNVTATDYAPTSGLPSDTITVKNGESVISGSSATADSNATENSTVIYSYELGNKDSAYDLSFTVKDNAGNTATKSLVDLIKEDKEKTKKVVVANADFTADFTKDDYDNITDFEVVSNNEEDFTFIDTFTGTDEKEYDDNDNIIRHGKSINVTSQVKVSNKAGVNNISNIECYYYNDDQNTENKVTVSADEKYDYSSKKTTSAKINFNITTKETGKYILKYTATNNAGVSKTNTKTFYVDNTAPVISQFTFKNGNPAKNPDSVIKTEYGYYFKNTTTVEVTAVDGGVDSPVSGVSEIHFYTIGTDGIQSDEQIVSVSGNNQTSYKATFTVPANFKGNVYAYAVDKAGNCYYFDTTTNKDDSQPVTPDRVVVENSSKHEQMSGIDISLPATNYIESSNKLYNNDVNVALNVSDSYSGIAKIEYSVSSEFDTDNNWDGSIEYSNDQSATTAMNGNGTVSGWKIEESDQNLVTKASSTITVKNNSNNIKIEVKLTDRAGNVSTKKETLSIDKTKPTIKIEYDNNNHTTHNGTEFYKANRTATITVTERNFSPEDVISKITNTDNVIPQITGWTTHNVANGENPDGTTHTATVVYASDGDYIFDIAFTDMAGNKADKVAQHKFTVDKTIPTINVSFDNNSAKNNNYYKADRTATITVNEHNFNAQDVKVNISATVADKSTAATAPSVSSWTSNGNIHTATVKFANDGKYAFDVNYTDLADNAAKENVVTTFYVDKTAPAVKISNVENESANSGNVAPVINLGDNNYSGDYVLTLTRVDIEAKKTDVTNDFVSTVVPTSNTGAVVTYANFASDEVNDGIYVLNAALTDKAGNSSNDTITFSVNRFGSTYMGGNKETNDLLDNGYTNAEKDIVISEINVDNLTKSNISLSLDSSSLKTLKQNVDYTVNEDAKTGQWHKYNYTVKSSNFVNEGNYSIELSSTDAAKNTSTNRIRPIENRKLAVQFVVDKTAPVVNIAGIENNALYEENSKDVTVVCEDSYIDANSLVIKLDDKTLKEGKDYTVEKDVASISAKIKVNATSDITAQNVKVSVKDMAQNSGDGSVENFTLSATLLMRFFANPVLVIISAVLFAGIIALVIFIVAKKRRKN